MVSFFLLFIFISFVVTIYMVSSEISSQKEEEDNFRRDLDKIERGEPLSYYD